MMKGKIILETWFETGLGDFYACLISLKEGYDKLISLGYDVHVRINSKVSFYHDLKSQNTLLEECLDFSLFNENLKLNVPIDEDFIKLPTVAYAYNIYVHKENENLLEIQSLDLYGYSVENIAKGGPYPSINNRKRLLFNHKFLNEIENITIPFGKFIMIHLRYDDSHLTSETEVNQIKQLILDIHNNDKDLKILLSSHVKEINDIMVDGVDMVTFNYEVNNIYDRMKRDLLNMSIFAYCDKLYTRTVLWSNYQTLGLVHNINGKSYEDFIEMI
jgi:hypothetical protein